MEPYKTGAMIQIHSNDKSSRNFFFLHGLFAFHMEVSTGYKLIEETFYEHEKCGLKKIDFLNLIDPWFVI